MSPTPGCSKWCWVKGAWFSDDELAAEAIQHLGGLACSHEGPRAFPGTFGLPTSFRLQGVEEKKMLKSPERYLEDGISYPEGK